MPRTERTLQQQLRSPWPWHRWLGIAAAIVLLWAAITGMLLIHSDDLALAQRPVAVEWVLDLFSVPAPEVELGYRSPLGWVAQAGDRVYMDLASAAAVELPAQLGDLTAVATSDGAVLVAGSEALILLDAQGNVLEMLAPDADPALGALSSVAPEALPEPARTAIARAARSSALDWEQVVRVLHGSHGTSLLGKVIADLTGLSLLVLSLTGLAMFRQRRRWDAKKHGEDQGQSQSGATGGDGEE